MILNPKTPSNIRAKVYRSARPGEVVGHIIRPEYRQEEILCGSCRRVIYYRGNAYSRFVLCPCGLVNDIQARIQNDPVR